MDDILASIRRIIADDHPGQTASAPASEPDAGERDDEPAGYSRHSELSPTLPEEPIVEAGSGETPPIVEAAPDNTQSWPAAGVADLPDTDPPDAEALIQPPPTRPTIAQPRPALHRVEPAFAPPPPPRPAEPPRHQPPFAPDGAGPDSLLSQAAMASVGDAFQALSHTVLSTNSRTLEDLVKDMLRPMLQGWLDDNLPPLVERLVRAEIERVARGRS